MHTLAAPLALAFGLVALPAAPGQTTATPASAPAAAAFDLRKLDAIEPLVRQAMAEKKLPGAVVLIGRGDPSSIRRPSATAPLVPAVEPMTVDTIFDLASLTKVVATTTSVMMLVERRQDPAERPRRARSSRDSSATARGTSPSAIC